MNASILTPKWKPEQNCIQDKTFKPLFNMCMEGCDAAANLNFAFFSRHTCRGIIDAKIVILTLKIGIKFTIYAKKCTYKLM